MLDATRHANLAELTLVQNRAARLNYSVDLFSALGGGWSDADHADAGRRRVPRRDADGGAARAVLAAADARRPAASMIACPECDALQQEPRRVPRGTTVSLLALPSRR